MEYLLHILILIGIYIILSVSLNLIVGYAGLLSIAHAAFYGVGAYVAALLALKFNSPFLANIICAIILSGLLGAMVGRLEDLHPFSDQFFNLSRRQTAR
jgi:branched-chain amino acid transport system permease protein